MDNRSKNNSSDSTTPRKGLTVSEYMKLPETNQHCELIEGLLIREPSPTADHQTILGSLHLRIGLYVEARELGLLLLAPMDVVLGENVLQPDLLFISKPRLHIIRKGRVYGVPDLVVEILSRRTTSRDQVWKRDFYAQHGILEYWIVDPFSGTAEVLELSGDEYHVYSRIPRDGKLTSSVLPGLDLSLTEIFGYGGRRP